MTRESRSPAHEAGLALYQSAAGIVEIAAEQRLTNAVSLFPNAPARHDFGDNTVILLDTDTHELPLGSAEFSDNVPAVQLNILRLHRPLSAHPVAHHELVSALFDEIQVSGGSGLLQSRRTVTTLPTGELTAADKSLVNALLGLDAAAEAGDDEAWEKAALEYVEQSGKSRRLQKKLGLDVVSLEERGRLQGALDETLRLMQAQYGISALIAQYGPRASQRRLHELWATAHELLQLSADLVCPPAFLEGDIVFRTRMTGAHDPTRDGEPHREQVYTRREVAKRAARAAGRLGVQGTVTVRNTYEYAGNFLQGEHYGATLEITYPCQRDEGKRQRTVRLHEMVGMDGLRLARVDGPLPYREGDPAVSEGRHLTMAESVELRLMLAGLQRGYGASLWKRAGELWAAWRES